MKTLSPSFIRPLRSGLLFFGLVLFFVSCGDSAQEATPVEPQAPEEPAFETVLWNVVALDHDGHSLAVKAFDVQGNAHDIKAIQDADQDRFMSVKAMVNDDSFPVKILVGSGQYTPVKAIGPGGVLYDIKAITAEGEKLAVMGVVRIGSIVAIEAVTPDGDFYAVRAISPEGKLNTVKGIKINTKDREMTLQGVPIHAHVKAMHPAEDEDAIAMAAKKKQRRRKKSEFKRINWHIEAITPDGKNLDVKAFDPDGNAFDVKATQDSEQHSFMNIMAIIEGFELPVRIMDSPNEYAPVKAVGNDGKIYEVKAIAEDGSKLDVMGIARSGNIVHVKAITADGEILGVKAFSPDGQLNAVKGVKIFDRKVELTSKGHAVYAHLKAIN